MQYNFFPSSISISNPISLLSSAAVAGALSPNACRCQGSLGGACDIQWSLHRLAGALNLAVGSQHCCKEKEHKQLTITHVTPNWSAPSLVGRVVPSIKPGRAREVFPILALLPGL